jgi:acyl-CoA thioesterase-1
MQSTGLTLFFLRKTAPFGRGLLFLALLTGLWSCGDSAKTEQATQESPRARSAGTSAPATPTGGKKTLLFFGNSLTAGYGVEPSEAFPARIGQYIDSLGLGYRVVNAGLSGETTAGGKSRVGWVLRQPVDVFVLELGGNDGLRGIPVRATEANLQAIIDTVRLKSPAAQIVLAGMQIPPNMGPDYASQFRAIYQRLADKNNLVLIPFLLEGVGGVARLNQPDGIHPTPEGHRLVARTIWPILEPVLRGPVP